MLKNCLLPRAHAEQLHALARSCASPCGPAARPLQTALWNDTPDAVLAHLHGATARPRHIAAAKGAAL